MRRRVAARKLFAATTGSQRRREQDGAEQRSAYEAEVKKIQLDLWEAIGSPNLPTKQRQVTASSPLGSIMKELDAAAADDDDMEA